MNSRQSRQIDTLHSADAFVVQNAAQMPSVAASGMQQDLKAALTSLETHLAGQAGHRLIAQGTTQRVASLRQSLVRDHMGPIAGIAAAKLPKTPEFVAFRLPRQRMSDRKTAQAAEGMAAAAAPFSQVFFDAGLPQDFLAQLTSAADTMLASRDALKKAQGQRSGATKGLDDKLREGRRSLRALNKFVVSALKDDPALLANWQTITRVGRSAPARVSAPTAGSGAVAGGSAPSVPGAVAVPQEVKAAA